MSEPATYTDAKDIPAWRQLIANGEIVAIRQTPRAPITSAAGWAE